MINEVKNMVDEYIHWLKDKTILREIKGWVEITTPYLDRHNDYLQIYTRKDENGQYLITDDGYIIQDLSHSGVNLDSRKRQELLKITLNGYGVELNKEALITKANNSTFSVKKHNLIQAMLAVNDLFYLSSPMVASLFLEDVTNWLDLNDIRYITNVKFTGKSGFDHLFDFAIPKSKEKPERIIKAINKPDRNTAEALAFSWLDTRDVRPEKSVAYALLNDFEKYPSSAVLDALHNYDLLPIPWSEREKYKTVLSH